MSHLRLRLVTAVAALVALSSAGGALAAPSDLFFSEYIEGSSNNKALEIYNGTAAPINLAADGYSVQMFFNGSASAGLTINLTGTVATGDVFVLAQSAAAAAILAQADQTNGAGWFNGDDAVVLRKGTTVLDVIGQVGFDPGTEWGTGLTSTADNTLRRKTLIESGDPTTADAFDPAVEWDGFATDTFLGLGAHPGLPPEPAPTVASSSPSNGATDVALNAPVSITFSEPVDVAATWYTLSCSSSGAKTATVSGGPTTFVVQPTTAFVGGESCTFTVLASGVTDQDVNDPYDAMAADVAITFTTSDTDPCSRAITSIPAIQGSGASAAVTGAVTTRGVVVGDYEGAEPGAARLLPPGRGRRRRPGHLGRHLRLQRQHDTRAARRRRARERDGGRVPGSDADQRRQSDHGLRHRHGRADRRDAARSRPPAISSGTRACSCGLPQTLYVTEHFQLGRFGQVVMSSGGRLQQPTNVVAARRRGAGAAGAERPQPASSSTTPARRRTPTRSCSGAAATRSARRTRCAAATRRPASSA